MEEKYCAFLRGINVNGITIKMGALKDAFIKMGFPDARTILATGNVIFTLAEENHIEGGPTAYIEKVLSQCFGFDAHVIMRSSGEIQDISDAAQTMDIPEEYHNYYLLCDDREKLLELMQLFDSVPHEPSEQFNIYKSGAFWMVPQGSTLSSNFGSKVLGNQKYKSVLTSRNMNTIRKIHKAMTD